MTTLFDADGNAVEGAMTAEEAAAAEITARQDEAAKILADKGGDGDGEEDGGKAGEEGDSGTAGEGGVEGEENVEQLKAKLAAATADIEKLRDKDTNFGKLREEKEAAEAARKAAEEALVAKEKEKDQAVLDTRIDAQIVGLSGGDEGIGKKIRFHFERLRKPEDTPEELVKKVRDAYILASGAGGSMPGFAPDLSALGMSAGGGIPPVAPVEGETLTPQQTELGHKFGLSDEDLKKHGGASKTHTTTQK